MPVRTQIDSEINGMNASMAFPVLRNLEKMKNSLLKAVFVSLNLVGSNLSYNMARECATTLNLCPIHDDA